MWLLAFLPDWIFYAIFILGIGLFVATIVLKFIPIIYMKRLPIQFVSIALISIGAFMSGMAYNEMNWQLKVKEMEAKVAQSEVEAAKKNVEIVEKIIFKDRVIKERGDEVVKFIDREVVTKEEVIKFVENCPVPQEIVDAHNRAVNMGKKQ
jgi:energy-coupling factor transporter transmembrane protein EcfT